MCDELVWLKNGEVQLVGAPDDVIAAYRGDDHAR
jgi:ABC-type polysaccharide/polyol phosphate transport system ATPase subunit